MGKIKVGIVTSQFQQICDRVTALVVTNLFLLNILRKNGWISTKFCVSYCASIILMLIFDSAQYHENELLYFNQSICIDIGKSPRLG